MQRLWVGLVLMGTVCAQAQMHRTQVPVHDTLVKALEKSSLTGEGAKPFHIRIEVAEPKNPQSSYQGTIEEWWLSADQWRREVSDKDGMRQTIVVANGKTTEKDEGDYFPLWLRMFVDGAFNPVPDANHWESSNAMIEQVIGGGVKTEPCAHAKSKIGPTDAFFALCFDDQGRLSSYVSPAYAMEFQDYHGFDKRQIPRRLVNDPEPGTELVGTVTILEDEAKAKSPTDTFVALPGDDTRFERVSLSSQEMQALSLDNPAIKWPTVRSGIIHGNLAMYISVDTQGKVREAWPLNSDNAGLNDPARDQVRTWMLKPTVINGRPVQVDGGLGFTFDTTMGEPLPELSEAETRQLAMHMEQPAWPPQAKPGQKIELIVSVDENGKVAGVNFVAVTNVTEMFAAADAVKKWSFKPLIRDGKPQYFHGHVTFTVP